jgi:hypothetical protein
MQPRAPVTIRLLNLDELEQSRKRTLLIHHLKGNLILPAVEEKKRHNEV